MPESKYFFGVKLFIISLRKLWPIFITQFFQGMQVYFQGFLDYTRLRTRRGNILLTLYSNLSDYMEMSYLLYIIIYQITWKYLTYFIF